MTLSIIITDVQASLFFLNNLPLHSLNVINLVNHHALIKIRYRNVTLYIASHYHKIKNNYATGVHNVYLTIKVSL